MRKLKNWTVTSKSVKNGLEGFLNYANYLNDSSRHKDEIINDISSKHAIKNMAYVAERFNLRRKLNKGGRPSNMAWSTVLSYPFEVSDDEFKALTDEILTEFYKYVNDENDLNLSDKEIKNIVDNQSAKVIHRGKTNHVHLLLAKHFKKTTKSMLKKSEAIVSIDLTKKKYTHRLKGINDLAVEKIMNINKVDYQIQAHEEQKKRKTRVTLERDKISSLRSELELVMATIRQRLDDDLDREELERVEKAVKTVEKQLENENTERAEKTIKKIRKNFLSPGM